jgi:serine protease Do
MKRYIRTAMLFCLSLTMVTIIIPGTAFADGERGYFGLKAVEITTSAAKGCQLEPPRGAEVAYVIPDGPAHQSGVMAGDVLLRFGGVRLENERDLLPVVRGLKIGDEVKVILCRDGQKFRTKLGFVALPDSVFAKYYQPHMAQGGDVAQQSADQRNAKTITALGVTVRDRAEGDALNEGPWQNGVIVTTVDREVPAFKVGLRTGQIIYKVGNVKVSDSGSFLSGINNSSSMVILRVYQPENDDSVLVVFER